MNDPSYPHRRRSIHTLTAIDIRLGADNSTLISHDPLNKSARGSPLADVMSDTPGIFRKNEDYQRPTEDTFKALQEIRWGLAHCPVGRVLASATAMVKGCDSRVGRYV
uniref:SFRICE_016257 n=1 Tax=Spodoptera frugiperda TaxID=7108 RepID=A0A2H1WS34_SPOFR